MSMNSLIFFDFNRLDLQDMDPEPDGSTLQNQAPDEQSIADQRHASIPSILPQEYILHGSEGASPVMNVDAQAMAPPPKRRRKKAPTLRAKDWEPYKARVLELHDTQKKPLSEVRKIIEKEFGFIAEIRQYRTRITQWGKDKNIKPAEMAAIVRRRQRRKILESDKREQIFTVRGREVEPYKIDRWMNRHDVSQTHLYIPSPAASTPSAVDCRTISERGSTANSPAFSEMDLAGRITPVTGSPMVSSPTFTVQRIIPSCGSTFTIQSPAPTYQTLSAQISASYPPAPDPVHPHSSSALIPQQSNYKQAEEECLQELYKVEAFYGAEHIQTLSILTSLAQVLMEQGRYESAEEMIHRAVEGYRKATGDASEMTLGALDLLGRLLLHQGLYHEAEKLLNLTLNSKKAVLGEEHLSTLVSMSRLSTTYIFQNRYQEAEALEVQALWISTRLLGGEDPETLLRKSNLGFIYTRFGRIEVAEELIRQALELTRIGFGDEHTRTLLNMNRLLSLYTHQGRQDEAEVLAIQVVNMGTRLLGEEHPSTIQDKSNLALIYENQGRLKEAEELGVQVLEMSKKTLGKKHPNTFHSADDLIRVYKKQGKYKEAEELGGLVHIC